LSRKIFYRKAVRVDGARHTNLRWSYDEVEKRKVQFVVLQNADNKLYLLLI